jgi:phosphoribosylglycinamide formyltransferase-1
VKKIVVLISGSGSNMVAIKNAIDNGVISDTELSCVISNEPEAGGIEKAQHLGLPTQILSHKNFETRELFDEELVAAIKNINPDLIILAGFMRILTSIFTSAFSGKILNIHPSLLPKYPGLHTHESALKNDDREHGITIHFVTEELDEGPIIAQGYLVIGNTKDPESLQQRIHQIEHDLYPKIINEVVRNNIVYSSQGTIYHSSCQNYQDKIFYAL